MNLTQIALGRAIGSSSYKTNKIYSRLACFLTLATLAGWSMANVAQDLALTTLPHAGRLYLSITFIFQLISCTAIVTSTSYSRIGVVTRIALTLPLSKGYVGFLGLLPALVMAFIFLLISLPPLGILFSKLGLSWIPIIVVSTLGMVSSFGIMNLARSGVKRWLTPVGILASEYALLHFLQSNLLSPPSFLLVSCMIALCAMYATTTALAIPAFTHYHLISALSTRSHNVNSRLPLQWWMSICAYRNKTTLASLGLNLVMSIIASVTILHYHLPTSLAATFGALLLAACASDFRGLFGLVRPAEITALDATRSFLRRTFFVSFVMGVLSVSPLLLLAEWPGNPFPFDRLVSMLLLASALGTGLSHIFASAHRTILLPFAVTGAAFFLLCFLPGKAIFADLAWWWQDSFYLAVAVTFRLLAERVEYKRNPFMWRSKNQ